MKKIWLFFLLLVTFMGSATAVRAEAEAAHEGLPVGERLEYTITWLGIPVGIGAIEVKEKTQLNGREVYYVVGMIETNKVLRKIFPVHDEAHSWIDAKTFESLQFEKKIHELFIDAHERTVFDAAKGKGYLESFKTALKKEFDVKVPVHDVISTFYWARRQTLTQGSSNKIVLTADQKNWTLELDVRREESVKIHGKKIKTIRVEPHTVVEGVEKRGKAWFNVTTDASHTPIRIAYKAPFGRMVGTLKEEID